MDSISKVKNDNEQNRSDKNRMEKLLLMSLSHFFFSNSVTHHHFCALIDEFFVQFSSISLCESIVVTFSYSPCSTMETALSKNFYPTQFHYKIKQKNLFFSSKCQKIGLYQKKRPWYSVQQSSIFFNMKKAKVFSKAFTQSLFFTGPF